MKAHCAPQNSSLKNSTSQTKRLSNGRKMERSKLQEQKEDIEDIFVRDPSSQSLNNPTKNNISYIQESPLQSKKMTLVDKSNFFNPNIQTIKLSMTSAQESISNEEDFSPFWTSSLEGEYKKLFLPTKTALHDLDSNFSNISLKNLECKSQLCQMKTIKTPSMTSPKTSYQSLQFSQHAITDQDPIIKCRKLRIYPNKEQTILFNKCIGASRFFFNQSKSHIEQIGVKGTGILNLKKLRPIVMKSDKDVDKDMEWQKEVPYDTRQSAISEAIAAYKGGLTKLRNRMITHFEVKYKSKKNQTSQAFRVNKSALDLDSLHIFPRRFNKRKRKLRMRKRDRDKKELWFKAQKHPDGDFTILKTRPSHWYLCVPQKVSKEQQKNEEEDKRENKSVFLDPGVRTFQTIYSPDGICGKIGLPHFNDALKDLADKHDRLWSVSDLNKEKRKQLRRRCALLRLKIKNKVYDLHWQTCALLCGSFKHIFLPHFRVSDMVHGSPLGSFITRKMLQLSHGAFKEKMTYFAKTKQSHLHFVNEHYTTKTCGQCGHIQTMDGLKEFQCEKCNVIIDRDFNGARNICLKLMTALMTKK